MDAIYFGNLCWFTPCTGSGPWVEADMENGLFIGRQRLRHRQRGQRSPFVTAMLNNNGTTDYTMPTATPQSGGVTTRVRAARCRTSAATRR